MALYCTDIRCFELAPCHFHQQGMIRRALGSARAFSSKVNIVVAGGGWWSQRNHLPHLSRHPDVNLVGIIEPNPAPRSTFEPNMATRDQLQTLYRCPVFHTMDDLIQSEVSKNVTGIIVCTTHHTHFDIGTKALNLGWHVLMEKPMVTDPVQAIQLARLAEKTGKVFLVNNSANWRPQSKAAFELVSSGVIGSVEHASVTMASPLMWLFDNPVNEGWVRPTGSMRGNGFAWGQLSHSLAWILKVTGLTPCKVQCHMKKSARSGADLFDAALISCTNGACINLQGITTNVAEEQTKVSGKLIENRIYGTLGSLSYCGYDSDPASGNLTVNLQDGRQVSCVDGSPLPKGFLFEELDPEGTGPGSVQAFIQGCLGEPYFEGVGADIGMKTVLVLDAMYRSAESGVEAELYSD